MDTPQLLTIREVRDRLRVSEATVRRFMAQGSLPYLKLGKALRFEARAVEAFVEAHRKKGGTECN